eukprot:scaffold11797_cov123-Isochrysis_galbana.AAC.6
MGGDEMRSTNITAQIPPQHPLRAAAGRRLFFPRSLARISLAKFSRRHSSSFAAHALCSLLTHARGGAETRSRCLYQPFYIASAHAPHRPHHNVRRRRRPLGPPQRQRCPASSSRARGAPGAPRPTTDKEHRSAECVEVEDAGERVHE